MAILMLLWLFLISHNGINGHTYRINYWNEQQMVTVTKNGDITNVHFGDIVDTGLGSNSVYIGNGYWRTKYDPTSAIWPSHKHVYTADDICRFQQFVKTPFEVLDGQLNENKGYTDEAYSRRRFIEDEEDEEGCKLNFNRQIQHVTINRDGVDVDVRFGDIFLNDGKQISYVGNKQWIFKGFDWCLGYMSAIAFLQANQFESTYSRLSEHLIEELNTMEWGLRGSCFGSASLVETERQLSDVNENHNMYKLEITGKYINLWIIIGCVLVVLCCISLGCNAWYIKKQKNTSGTYSNVVQSDSEKVLFVQ